MDAFCCEDLADAITGLPNSFFRTEDNGVLYRTVGYVQTAEGPGWFDQAVIFCPSAALSYRIEMKFRREPLNSGSVPA